MEMVAEQSKKLLRKELLEKLLSLTKEEAKRRSNNVNHTLSGLPIYKKAKVVMVYYPLKGEVDIWEILRKAGNKRFCFPVMDLKRKDLVPYEVVDLNKDFIRGPYGVMQPDLKRAKEVNVREIDIVIVPGLGFDYKKNRLGRGGGFYDHFLRRIQSPAKKVGVAFQFQILPSLPVYPPLDEKVDFVVSEKLTI